MLREGIPYEGAWFYSVTTSMYVPLFVLGLFLTNAFLLAGNNAYIPVYVVFIVGELLKYAYIQLAYFKDVTYSPKQGFKMFSIVFYFIKQIKPLELFRSALVLSGFTSIVFVAAVLFGAEALGRHEETLMFSCLITVLTVFPICLHQGVPSVLQFVNGYYGSDAFSQVLLRNVQLTVLGSWLGAFVIPLDWDRPWQAWPIPCSLAALVGFAAAQFVSLVEIYSKHFRGKNKLGSGKHR